jgi:hypothetical protein
MPIFRMSSPKFRGNSIFVKTDLLIFLGSKPYNIIENCSPGDQLDPNQYFNDILDNCGSSCSKIAVRYSWILE